MGKSDNAIIGGILSLIIPGLGQVFIKSKYALHYFAAWVVLWVLTAIAMFITLGLCTPLGVIPLVFAIVAGVDAYYEANGEEQKRIMKKYIQ